MTINDVAKPLLTAPHGAVLIPTFCLMRKTKVTYLAQALAVFGLMLLASACASTSNTYPDVNLADPDATAETRALFANLKHLSADHVLFGHQDDLAYGVTWKREKNRSDVHDVTGAYPAVYGWELGDLEHG